MTDASRQGASGVLVGGVYGSGKSTVAEEMAARLEHAGRAFAALDLDWLSWFGTERIDPHRDRAVFLANLSAVVTNYLAAGVRDFVLAGSIDEQAELDEIRAAVPFPLTVVELRAPWDVIELRLRSSPTAGRVEDLVEARRRLDAAEPGPSFDAVIDADRPVGDVASEVLALVGWTARAETP
jgi:gluconate kinase